MGFWKKLFGGKKPDAVKFEFSEEDETRYYEQKQKALENMLGEMHHMVYHAIIPFDIGGALDLYMFKNHIDGTGIATMELLDPAGNGPMPNKLGTYELVAFTKYKIDDDENSNFTKAKLAIWSYLTSIGKYSYQAILNPMETIEVPNEGGENICLVFDNYKVSEKKFTINNKTHHLLLCLQVHRAEMDFARQNGTAELIELLKQKGHYPYGDMDRPSVV